MACDISSFKERLLQLRLRDGVSLLQRSVLNALQTATDLSLQRIGVAIIEFPQGMLVEIAKERSYLGIQVGGGEAKSEEGSAHRLQGI